MSSSTLTFDESPPRRPALEDLGGGAKENDDVAPDPVRDATAEDFNQMSKLLAALARVMPVAQLSVTLAAGVHVLERVSCAPSAPGLATFTLTDHGIGDISLTWPVGTFPPAVARHRAHVTGAVPALISAETLSDGVRVRTWDAAGAPVDVTFDVELF